MSAGRAGGPHQAPAVLDLKMADRVLLSVGGSAARPGSVQLSRVVAYASMASRWYTDRPGAIVSYAARHCSLSTHERAVLLGGDRPELGHRPVLGVDFGLDGPPSPALD